MSPAEIFNMLNNNNQTSSSSNEEKQTVKYRLNFGYYEMRENGLVLISLPFGIALELNEKQRRGQFPKSLALMDSLAEIASNLDEGAVLDLFPPKEGEFGVQLRHVAKSQQNNETISCSALDALKASLAKK